MTISPPARLALLAGMLTFAPVCKGATLYSQNFNAGGSTSTLSTINWSGWGALGSATATTYTTSLGTSPDSRLGQVTGNTGGSKAIFAQSRNSGSPTIINDRFVVTSTTINGPHQLGSIENVSLGTLSWKQSLTAPTGANSQYVQVLVQVDNVWYASVETFTNSAGGSSGNNGTNNETKEFDLAGATGLGTTSWYGITFGDNSPITIGSQVTNPIGDTITGIGFAMFTGNGSGRTVWIDDVEINSIIPEPSSALLAAAGVLALSARRRRAK
ncbi:hypothetical protein OVA24_09310 [Luteolibacter sp. SL250]|uniref:PEP-CTERM sorting domain-containing protein n=1 Tax=Luteolibacter sp. SL250 TaxID=2995170 RepID=UPI002271C27D|nr:PEP-CTERM sorting domain-containing protein [Luteolibacter sp. SL250]WAC21581.1 hypothetical protein OVA24_09310 [Luteolibacter sp. SL250]